MKGDCASLFVGLNKQHVVFHISERKATGLLYFPKFNPNPSLVLKTAQIKQGGQRMNIIFFSKIHRAVLIQIMIIWQKQPGYSQYVRTKLSGNEASNALSVCCRRIQPLVLGGELLIKTLSK